MSIHLVAPIAVAIVFALLRWMMPVTPADAQALSLTDAERRLYYRWEVASLVPFFVFGPALTWMWYHALRELAGLAIGSSPDAVFVLAPTGRYWVVPSIFLGIVSAVVPMTLLYQALLGERFPTYERAAAERVGFDGRRALKGMSVLFGAATVVFFACAVNSTTRFTKDDVKVGNAFSFEARSQPYERVTAVLHRATFEAPSGKIVRRPHYVVQFADGTEWSTRQGLREPEPQLDAQVARFVAERAKLTIREE